MMRIKHLCVGTLSFLITSQIFAFSQSNEVISKSQSRFQAALKKVSSLVVIGKKDQTERGRRQGLFGATFGCYAGKFLVHFVGHGAILIAGAMTGPAAPATIAALEATFFPIIEATSNAAAVAGGIIGGVATGPV